MAKLNILGAQRVKALTEMLNENEKQAIVELKASMPTQEQIKQQVNEEFGVQDLQKRAKELELELRELLEEIKEITGEKRTFNIHNYGTATTTKWYERYKELQQENTNQIQEITKSYAEKKRKLWLCETLEEAKAIVGI